MDINTARKLTSIQKDIKEICKDQAEMKQEIRDLKAAFINNDKFKNLEDRVDNLKAIVEEERDFRRKIVIAIVLAVLGAGLSLVLI